MQERSRLKLETAFLCARHTMLNRSGLLRIEVKKTFGESSIFRILELVENATTQKAETNSNHLIAKSISDAFGKDKDISRIKQVEEISGSGIKAVIDSSTVLAANDMMLHKGIIEHAFCNV